MSLRPVFIEGRDLDDTWFQLLSALNDNGRKYLITSGSYAGSYRLAFDFVSGFIHHPHARPLAPRMPESSNLPPPTTDTEIDHYFSEYLMHSKLEKNEDYRYSTWIVGGEYEIPYFECKAVNPQMWGYDPMKLTVHAPNQIEWVIDHFKTHGHGNEHCYITVGYPESNKAYDVPFTNEQERKTSPCLRGLDFRIIDGELTTSVYYRSWDLWSGWPCNMGGFVLLNEYVADSVGVYPGPLSFSCKSLHAYSFHMDVMDSRLGKSKWSKVL